MMYEKLLKKCKTIELLVRVKISYIDRFVYECIAIIRYRRFNSF